MQNKGISLNYPLIIIVITVLGSILYLKLSPEDNPPYLSVQVTEIINEKGEKFQIKGISVAYNSRHKKNLSNDKANNVEDSWFNEETVRKLAETGINLIDIHAIRLDQIIDGDGYIKQDFFEKWCDIWIEHCTENKIYSIISIGGFGVFDPSQGSWAMPEWLWRDYDKEPKTLEDQARVILDFWDLEKKGMDDERELFLKAMEYVANRYKENPYVMYSPINEPIHHVYPYTSSNRINHIGQSYSEIMTTTIDRMRSTGSNQIIFIDRPYVYDVNGDWDWIKNTFPINKDNIAWEIHLYISNSVDFASWTSSLNEAKELFENQFKKPLFIGEWGIEPPSIRHELGDWGLTTELIVELLNRDEQSWSYFSWDRLNGWYNWYYNETDNHLTPLEINELMNKIYHS